MGFFRKLSRKENQESTPSQTQRDLTLRVKGTGARSVPVAIRVFGNIEFVLVPTGKFIMGCQDNEQVADEVEKPQHVVDIPYDYWIARYPVTNKQFAAKVAEDRGSWANTRHCF